MTVLSWDQIQPKIANFPLRFLPLKDYCIGCDKTVEVKIEDTVGVHIVRCLECQRALEFMYDDSEYGY